MTQTVTDHTPLMTATPRSGLIHVDRARSAATNPAAGSSHRNENGPGSTSPSSTATGIARASTAIVRRTTSRADGYGVHSSCSNAGSRSGS